MPELPDPSQPLSADQNERVTKICARIAALPESVWPARLDQECAGNDLLRHQVERLLAVYRETTTLLPPRGADSTAGTQRTQPPRRNAATHGDDHEGFPEALRESLHSKFIIDEVPTGTGGMGAVYRASDRSLNRTVAIKVLRPDRPNHRNPVYLLREARAMAALRHPNLCTVIDAGGDDSTGHYLVMEWIDGIPIDRYVIDLPLDRRLHLFASVLSGIAEMHRVGLIHRDIKPSNILVTRDDTPVVVDFGLVREVSNDRSLTTAGTPGYSAPEQFEPSDPLTPAADVFALGALLHQLLTGRPPPADGHPDSSLDETVFSQLPPPLQRICLQALERNPSRRYMDANEMRDDLRRFECGESVLARPTVLADRFHDQVTDQQTRVETWRQSGMISLPEYRKLSRMLAAIRMPDTPWVMESRRLTASQVWLNVGGWAVVLSLSIGMWHAWDTIRPGVATSVGWGVLSILICAAVSMWRARERRFALMWFTVAAIVWPVCVWLLLRLTNFPAPTLTSEDSLPTELVAYLTESEESEPGFGNLQLLLNCTSWLGISLLLRAVLRCRVFTSLATICTTLVAASAWLSLGRLAMHDGMSSAAVSEFAMVLLVLSIGMLLLGLRLDAVEQSMGERRGLIIVVRDSPPIVVVGTLLIPSTLAIVSYLMPSRWLLYVSDEYPTVRAQALGFIASGAALQILSHLLARRETVLRARVGELLRWIAPSFLLAPLFVLERDDAYGVWWVWLSLMGVTSLGFCAASIVREWRPYLIAGLAYLGLAYARCFVQVHERMEHSRLAVLVLVGAAAVLGLATMMCARWLPQLRRSEGSGLPVQPGSLAGTPR